MQAVILAGGAGTRLWPLTKDTPKPMLDVNGKPFLLYIIEELKRYGIKEYVLCIGYLAEKFKEYFGDGSKFGVKIQYSVEDKFLGTGGALKYAKDLLEDDFFVVNGDTYLPIDYSDVYEKFKGCKKSGMLVLYNNTEKIAEANIAIDKKGNVEDYSKQEVLKQGKEEIKKVKKEKGKYTYIDAGVQVFKKEILEMIPENSFVSLEVDIFPIMIVQNDLASYVTLRRYYDLGTPERLELIRKVLK